MRLEEFAEVEAQKTPPPEVKPRFVDPMWNHSYFARGKNRSYICQQPAHNEEDCTHGGCDCPCHVWVEGGEGATAFMGDL